MDLGLRGRTAIVTGASMGMGLAIAEALAAEGANVAMFARRRDVVERHAERIGALAVRGDVRHPRDLEKLVSTTVEAFGGIDILVNNSGGPPRGSAVDMTDEAIEETVALLLLSVVRLTRLCLPYLEQSPAGRIVNVTSLAVKEPTAMLGLSNAVRPGVVGWAKSLATELGPKGITVNSIGPGRIDTDRMKEIYPDGPSEADVALIPLRRFGRAEEAASVVAFLASERASYLTGTFIPVDGGLGRGLL
jgi:3-oxoacyl-[acyl-carrier protein] reductase